MESVSVAGIIDGIGGDEETTERTAKKKEDNGRSSICLYY